MTISGRRVINTVDIFTRKFRIISFFNEMNRAIVDSI